jgi:hypothetical protein
LGNEGSQTLFQVSLRVNPTSDFIKIGPVTYPTADKKEEAEGQKDKDRPGEERKQHRRQQEGTHNQECRPQRKHSTKTIQMVLRRMEIPSSMDLSESFLDIGEGEPFVCAWNPNHSVPAFCHRSATIVDRPGLVNSGRTRQ